MIITTTDSVEGRQVAAYLGVVSGDAVMGTNIFKDFWLFDAASGIRHRYPARALRDGGDAASSG